MEWNKNTKKEIDIITIRSKKYQISLLNIGGAIYKLKTKNKDGKFENIVLTYKNINQYFKYGLYLGANIGRYAGRIEKSKFSINKKLVNLVPNDSNNFIHGGINGTHKLKMAYQVSKSKNSILVSFYANISEKDDGIPGDGWTKIVYICTENDVRIEYSTLVDSNSIFNPTNHTYFNLNGEKDLDIKNHLIVANIDYMWETNKSGIPNDLVKYNYFKKGIFLEDVLKQKYEFIKKNNGLDNPFEIEGSIKLVCKETKRAIEISSSYKSLVIYTQGFKSNQFIENRKKKYHNGIAMEFQNVPNDINRNDSKSFIKKGEIKKQWIKYTIL